MKKILFVIMVVIFCTANYSAAASLAEGKEKKIDNIDITIGDWKINGKLNGKIYISDDSEKDNKGRIKLGDSDAVTYSNGAIIVYMDEEKIEQLAADLEKNIGQLAAELEDTFSDIEINGKRLNSNDWENLQNRPNRIKGSGNIISKTIPAITSYDAIKASRGVRVVMEEREDDNITIKADDNVMPYVVVRKDGNSLIIGIDKNINSLSNINVEVFLPKNSNLNELKAASGATININTTIESRTLSVDAASAAKVNFAKADVDFFDADAASAAKITGIVKSDDCYLDASSAADIKLTLLAVQCKSAASSAASIELKGQVATFNGDASSAAKIYASELEAQTLAEADASSGAKVTVKAIKRLDAEASSGGVVSYIADDDVITKISQSSGGRVKKY